jgi:hypothetical protein
VLKLENHEVNNLVLQLSWKNRKLLADLKKRYHWDFERNLLNYLITYRKEVAKE